MKVQKVLVKFRSQHSTCGVYDIYICTLYLPNTVRSPQLNFSFSAILTSPPAMAKSTNRRGRMRQKKDKDEREWTTPEEKMYLLSRQANYSVARDKKNLKAWFSVELAAYFDKWQLPMKKRSSAVPSGPLQISGRLKSK
jgi:hypothetical protein